MIDTKGIPAENKRVGIFEPRQLEKDLDEAERSAEALWLPAVARENCGLTFAEASAGPFLKNNYTFCSCRFPESWSTVQTFPWRHCKANCWAAK